MHVVPVAVAVAGQGLHHRVEPGRGSHGHRGPPDGAVAAPYLASWRSGAETSEAERRGDGGDGAERRRRGGRRGGGGRRRGRASPGQQGRFAGAAGRFAGAGAARGVVDLGENAKFFAFSPNYTRETTL